MPARAPASIAILQRVMRPSIERLRIVEPLNSITCPVPTPVPSLPIIARATSFAVTPGANSPSMRIFIVLGFFCKRHCVASTCSTSLVPMPIANTPKAPCVEVCESPQTSVMPGSVIPGMTLVCGDSHTSTHGALGVFAMGIGTTEVEHVLATQCLLQNKPKTMNIRIEGKLAPGVTAKDMAL